MHLSIRKLNNNPNDKLFMLTHKVNNELKRIKNTNNSFSLLIKYLDDLNEEIAYVINFEKLRTMNITILLDVYKYLIDLTFELNQLNINQNII